jgi:hypothetical protein
VLFQLFGGVKGTEIYLVWCIELFEVGMIGTVTGVRFGVDVGCVDDGTREGLILVGWWEEGLGDKSASKQRNKSIKYPLKRTGIHSNKMTNQKV